ncbi:hypothetical protein [Fortiea contorta]|uniref:hypothetical protein n=1 Tax=Fortiea contorta TaxID=1892405 RepID=UPI001EE65768|nr:hypothetical protein [Fortiea contorta]
MTSVLLAPAIFSEIMLVKSSAIASEKQITQQLNSQVVNSDDAQDALPKSSIDSELELKQNSQYTTPSLPETDPIVEFRVSDIIPIERYKVEPPPNEQDENQQPQPNTSNQQPKKTYTLTQKILIYKLRQSKKVVKNQQLILIDALSLSANRYPWIINPTDKFTFSPSLFKPNKHENYGDTDLSVRLTEDNQVLNKFTYGNFSKNSQFYWVLDRNRLVIETKGTQAGITYQGRSRESYSTQNMTSTQGFWGLQYINTLPTNFEELTGQVETNDFSITSIAGQLINPPGIPAGEVIINSGINLQNPNVTLLKNPTPILGSGSTLSPDGGGALFAALDAINAPKIIQAFPTTNLKPLLNNGSVRLRKGEIIPNSVLEATGILWGDILTGEGFGFTAPVSSTPGVKIAQLNKFDNYDLLNIAINPFLTPLERDLHYLNSLFWVSFGKRTPTFKILSETQNTANWYRLYINYPHNRSIIQYDPVKASATYANIFSSPGLSLTANFGNFSLDSIQTANSTLGFLMGGIFEAIKIDNIDQSLAEAQQKFKNGEDFASLNTQASAEQRREINNRLNRTLAYSYSNSGLEQVSGIFTIPSTITPNESNILQIRTGNYKRAVQFLQRNIELLVPGDSFFSTIRLSNEKFGPLTFIGNQIPLNNTSITPINESSAAEVILTNSQGKQFVQRFSSADNSIVPIPVRTFDLAFDYFELTRVDLIGVSFKNFNGYLYLPSIELLTSGSVGDLNYSASVGSWFNLDAKSAPGVNNNNLGLAEPSFGIYTNFLVNYIKTSVQLDANKKPIAINTHIPSLKVDWNSASNGNNPFSTVISYYFNHQQRNLSFSLAPAVAFIENNSNGEFLGLFNADFTTSTGFKVSTNIEMGKDIYYDLQSLQRLGTNFSIGAYVKNYGTRNLGLNSRVSGLNYGAIFRYQFPDNNVFLESQIGTGENGFDLKIQGGYRF